MIKPDKHSILIAVVTVIILLSSTSAFGFRCGRKIVTENMHEVQVIKACGNPTTSRHLGYAVRGTYVPITRNPAPGVIIEHFPGYGHYTEEVALTEFVYNFGPRKLMRRLLFEGGILMKIETIGYGYRENNSR